jgi:hypothetical protein
MEMERKQMQKGTHTPTESTQAAAPLGQQINSKNLPNNEIERVGVGEQVGYIVSPHRSG